MQLAVNDGYRRVKLKVKPGMDVEPIAAVRTAFPNLHLGFDANGSCGAKDGAFLQTLNAFQPTVIEQPFAPDRLDLCVELKQTLPTLRIGLDESVASLGDLIVAHRLGALDELNIKPGRVGGPLAALDSMSYCRKHNIPLWVGGMFETGVGRIANLRIAARLPNAAAHDLSPSRRYFPADVVQNPIDMSRDGYIEHDYDQPVILNENNLEQMRQQRIVLEK